MEIDFELLAPKHYNLAVDIDTFADDQSKVAIHWVDDDNGTTDITYRELRQLSNQFANVLQKLGLSKGDVIIIALPRIPETYIAFMGALKLGLIISPGSEMLMPKDLLYRINHSKAKAVICHHTLTDRIDQIREETKGLENFISVKGEIENWLNFKESVKSMPEEFEPIQTQATDSAFLCYTSGTSGDPKGVLHDHGWTYAHRALTTKVGFKIKPHDMVWSTASPAWVKWLHNAFINTLGAGATSLCYSGKLTGKKYLQIIEQNSVNMLCAATTEYRKITSTEDLADYALPSLKTALSAGEPVDNFAIEAFKKHFGVLIQDGYGQTESTLVIATPKDTTNKSGSMGKSTMGDNVKVINEAGEILPPNQVGTIAIRRNIPNLFTGYLNDPVRTNAAFHGDWFITGDLAQVDKDGYFWFEGRKDDIIISSGYTIGPSEVEEALANHPKVKECAVVPSPDKIRGAIVKAFVVLKNNTSPTSALVKDLQDHVKSITAPYKYPREIEFVSDLPRTISGKIRRASLRQLELERSKEKV